MHTTQTHEQDSRPYTDASMTDSLNALIDQCLDRGILDMTYTYGLEIKPVKYDVAAVAAVRLLDNLPGHLTIAEVLAGLNRRAVRLGQSDQREVM